MGTRVAPSFANTHMCKFKDDHVYTYHLQLFIYVRYLDDIFIVWQHGLDELNQFVDHLHSRTDSLEFTMEYSRESIPFLVKASDNAKPTEDQTILVTTFHPHDQMVPNIVVSNWGLLGKSHNTVSFYMRRIS